MEIQPNVTISILRAPKLSIMGGLPTIWNKILHDIGSKPQSDGTTLYIGQRDPHDNLFGKHISNKT